MRCLILLLVVNLSRARLVPDCPKTELNNGINYEKEKIKANIDTPYRLSLDHDKNVLFFSFNTPKDISDIFKSAFIKLETKEFGIVKKINAGFASAVDEKNHVVYLGGIDGVYTFDYASKEATLIGAQDTSIWQLFYKDKLFYSDYSSQTAYYMENGVSKKVPELEGTKVEQLVLDKDDNIIFYNSSGLFCFKRKESRIFKMGVYTVNGFSTNLDNEVFFSTQEGIYSIDEEQNIKLVVEVPYCYGVAIAEDNSIIYANSNSIVKLTPTNEKCDS